MKFVASIALFLLLIGGFVSPFYAYANNSSDEGLLCSVLGWFVRPLGFCEHVETVTVVTVDKEILKTLVETKPLVLTDTESGVASLSNDMLNDEQILIESNAVTEELLNQRIVEVLQYINSLPFGRVGDKITSNSQTLSNRDYVLKTVDRVYDRLGDNNDEIIDGGNLNDTTLFNAVLTGATSVESLYFNDNVPSSVLGRLYSTAGDLYWMVQGEKEQFASYKGQRAIVKQTPHVFRRDWELLLNGKIVTVDSDEIKMIYGSFELYEK